MISTDQLSSDLKNDEGVILHAYQDHLGYWTLGTGFLIDARKNGGISIEENDMILQHRIKNLLNDLCTKISWFSQKSDNIQRALFNMAYQMGINGLLNFKHMLQLIEKNDYSGAADEALSSTWAKQTPARANRIADLIRGE